MQTLVVKLAIDREEILRYYSGQAHNIQAISADGRTVRFPARFVRRFVNSTGLYGTFSLVVDAQYKLIGIEQIRSGS